MKKSPKLFAFALALSAALIASALMTAFTSKQSILAFAGWVIFYTAIALFPVLLTGNSSADCTTRLRRIIKK